MADTCRLSNNVLESKILSNQDENHCVVHVICVFISLVTILADLTTDLIVLAEYSKDGHFYWALGTLFCMISPNIFINIFSMRWYIIDEQASLKHWITHCCLVGLLERYFTFLRNVFACKNMESIKTHKFISQRNDLSLLHFLYIFLGTVPQVILQTYAVIKLEENYHTKVFSLAASVVSVIWGCAIYFYSIAAYSPDNFSWLSLILKLIWHFGMLMGRIHGILLFTITFGIWTLIPLGLHWTAMTFWIIFQKTTFCPNKIEETLYNVVMGFIYCFCYVNLREGRTRYRLILFCTLMISQNFGSVFVYIYILRFEILRKTWSIFAVLCVILGTTMGIAAMIIYYSYFHSKGPLQWKTPQNDIELNNKVVINKLSETSHKKDLIEVRSFKSGVKNETVAVTTGVSHTTEEIQTIQNDNADKKFLLDHWIARSGTPTFTSAPISNNSMSVSSVDINTVENTPQINGQNDEQNFKSNKIKVMCSPTDLNTKLVSMQNLEVSIDEITASCSNLHKRRGICPSDEITLGLTNLNLEICNIVSEDLMKIIKNDSSEISHDTDSSNKKTSSDSIDMDLDLSFSDINSSDINTFNENIVQKLCLSALKNIKVGNQDADIENIQRIALDILKEMYAKKDKIKNSITTELLSSRSRDLDTPTEQLSVHDYENICAVNIAREAWGLRSWNGYSDIENRLHDGSVVRDRRRDTLTSGSSEISSCISQDFRNAILAAPSFPKKSHTYSNVFIKFDKTNQDDYVNTLISHDDTFLAKPCMSDFGGKDPNHLEPILEELDDLGDIDISIKKRLNSESSLVATIDEIRKSTSTNSPRNMYHRREHLWDSPQLYTPDKTETNLQHALWKEPSKFDSSNILDFSPEKENNMDMSPRSKFGSSKKELNTTDTFKCLDLQPQYNSTVNHKNTRRQQIDTTSLKSPIKNINMANVTKIQDDFTNKEIDYLWQLVTDKSAHMTSTEDYSSNKLTSSLQSLIQKDTIVPVNTSSKLTNMKKSVRTKPRRKFSILRERFEQQISLSSDEEILYRSCENFQNPDSDISDIVNIGRLKSTEDCKNKQNDFASSLKMNTEVPADFDIASKNVKEKRSIFMKQVLNPPKFNTKLKHKA